MLTDDITKRVSADPTVALLARGTDIRLSFVIDHSRTDLDIVDGKVSPAEAGEPAFTLTMDRQTWTAATAARPAPGDQSLLAMIRDGRVRMEGDRLAFAQHLQLVRAIVEAMRPLAEPEAPGEASHRPLSMRGEYVRVHVEPWGDCDVFVERAGTGLPLICLATAGSDSRQYHGLVTETDLSDRYEIIAVDLPWHGKSDPAWGRRPLDYTLDASSYLGTIVAVVDALGLDETPILLGSSMAGAAVVEAVARHPQLMRGAVACQAGPRVAGRRTPWLRSPRVNQTLHVPEWTYGLMSPESPREFRDRVWWGYSQGGFGTYDADILYYTTGWDVENVRDLLSPSSPHVVVMSGAYDTSVPPEASRELASLIPNSSFRLMPELGHFPHAENPAAFATHLEWALTTIIDHADREEDRE